MPPKGASKKPAKGFAEILNAARAAGLTASPTDPDTANARNGSLLSCAQRLHHIGGNAERARVPT
jgi:hypothetical protein